jgi:hypothetical protein
LGERGVRIAEVGGSNPPISTNSKGVQRGRGFRLSPSPFPCRPPHHRGFRHTDAAFAGPPPPTVAGRHRMTPMSARGGEIAVARAQWTEQRFPRSAPLCAIAPASTPPTKPRKSSSLSKAATSWSSGRSRSFGLAADPTRQYGRHHPRVKGHDACGTRLRRAIDSPVYNTPVAQAVGQGGAT